MEILQAKVSWASLTTGTGSGKGLSALLEQCIAECDSAWFESLLAHDSALLRAAGLKLLVFCTPASEHLLKLVTSLAKQDPDDVVRGLALHCLGVILRQVPSPHAAATLRTTLADKKALPLPKASPAAKKTPKPGQPPR